MVYCGASPAGILLSFRRFPCRLVRAGVLPRCLSWCCWQAWPPRLVPARAAARCFPETGQCIDGRIREFWEQNGGLPVFGFPVAPQREEQVEGRPVQVQWFERNRLELHPENPRPYDVLLGRLGADRLAPAGPRLVPVPQRPAAGWLPLLRRNWT